jgi:hypothetical protein
MPSGLPARGGLRDLRQPAVEPRASSGATPIVGRFLFRIWRPHLRSGPPAQEIDERASVNRCALALGATLKPPHPGTSRYG